jgi:predicted ATPase
MSPLDLASGTNMLKTLAVANYRSINNLVIPPAETAQGGVVNALAREGGLNSTFWAGPETITRICCRRWRA